MARRQPRSLSGSTAVVTGGARGIGRALAAALIAQGVRVAIGDIDAEQVARSAEELGSGTLGFQVDVSSPEQLREFLDGAERELGPIDIFVNNAAIMPLGPFVEESDAMTWRALEINVMGTMIGSKLALERLLPRKTGHLVNVASTAGKVGLPSGVTYATTKHALVGLSESIREELVGTGVEIHLVMPTPVRTDMASGQPKLRGVPMLTPAQVADAVIAAIQHGRFEVYVPRFIGPVIRSGPVMPRALSEATARLFGSTRLLTKADPLAHAAYAARIAAQSADQLSAADRAASIASAAASVADAVGDD